MKRTVILLAVPLLAACASTKPLNGAGIDYFLPRTDAKLALDFTLRTCLAPNGQDPKISVDADLSLIPIPGAQGSPYRISGAELASARIKRSFKLGVNDKGVITGINSENEDQSPQILENVLKTATTIITGLGQPIFQDVNSLPNETELKCTPSARDAVSRSAWLKGEIVKLRYDLVQPATRGRRSLVNRINRYAKEKAALDTGILRIQTSAPIVINKNLLVGDLNTIAWNTQSKVKINPAPFDQWFGPAKPSPDANKSAREQLLEDSFGVGWAASGVAPLAINAQPIQGTDKTSRSCGFAIAVPSTAKINLMAKGTGTALPAGTEAKRTLIAAQHVAPNKLCVDVGFGESRNVSLTFDEYGRTSAFEWSSNATAVSGSSAIAGAASTASNLRSSLEGSSVVEKQEAEIKRLETQKKLNELRTCEAIIKAGGFNCAPETE